MFVPCYLLKLVQEGGGFNVCFKSFPLEMVIFAHNENRGFPGSGGHCSSQSNPSEISLQGDERTGVFLRKGGFPAQSSSLRSMECFLVCKERNGSAQTARHGDTRSQHNMTLSGKLAEGSPVAENVNALMDGRKKMEIIVFKNEELSKAFQSFNFILKALGC